MTYDVIVLGIGGMGSATVYELAKRGRTVLGLEQFNIAHEFGSSHGISRIIRLAYAEDPRYVPLLRRAYQRWREIETLANERLLFITGGVDGGPESGAIVQGSLRSCKEHALPHELLSATELRRRFPAFHFSKGMVAVYQPDAGFLLSERAIIAYVMAAQALGAEIHACERVRSWEVERGRVLVRTDRASYQARSLVITAGSWAAKLVPLLRKPRLAVPERQVVIWTQPRRPEYFRFGALPIFNMDAAEGKNINHYYGLPIYGYPGFKFGKYHHFEEEVDPDRMDRESHRRDENLLRPAIRKYFPDADGPTMALKTCLFTNSPDEHFVVDLHPDFPNVAVAAGFSGHGFKFASVMGEILADLALDGGSARFDLGLFSLTRSRKSIR